MPGGVEPSNLDKVFWPDQGLRKGDLLEYFDAVGPYILPALRDRPLTVKRYPDGIEGFMFYQKDTPKYAPSWVRRVELRAESAKRNVNYPLANSRRTLLWLANQAAIELHPWLSRTDRLDRPDFVVFDLDPPEGGFHLAVEVAHLVKEVLDELGLEACPKTSGSKGVHVYVPLRRRRTSREVRAAAETIARRVEQRAPDRTTTDIRLATRAGRVFLDVNRNAAGAHTVAVYSPRARPGAPVSFPVAWEDLGSIRIEDFTIRTVPALLERQGDVWRDLMPPLQSLPSELWP